MADVHSNLRHCGVVIHQMDNDCNGQEIQEVGIDLNLLFGDQAQKFYRQKGKNLPANKQCEQHNRCRPCPRETLTVGEFFENYFGHWLLRPLLIMFLKWRFN